MARIRSIHPGLFTDEAFVSATPFARLLIIGIWCEAFDDGCFEVKPLTLKMRLFPVDNVDVVALLAELENLGYFKRFETQGRTWAALRNFRKYQRPKKPNKSGVLPPELIDFVGKTGASTEPGPDDEGSGSPPVPHQLETGSPKSPQREDGGGKSREEREEPCPKPDKPVRARSAYPSDFEDWWRNYPTDPNMSKSDASKAWAKLTPDDRALASASLLGFKSWLKQQKDYRTVHAVKYLTSRRFEGHAPQKDREGNVVPVFQWAQTA